MLSSPLKTNKKRWNVTLRTLFKQISYRKGNVSNKIAKKFRLKEVFYTLFTNFTAVLGTIMVD